MSLASQVRKTESSSRNGMEGDRPTRRCGLNRVGGQLQDFTNKWGDTLIENTIVHIGRGTSGSKLRAMAVAWSWLSGRPHADAEQPGGGAC